MLIRMAKLKLSISKITKKALRSKNKAMRLIKIPKEAMKAQTLNSTEIKNKNKT